MSIDIFMSNEINISIYQLTHLLIGLSAILAQMKYPFTHRINCNIGTNEIKISIYQLTHLLIGLSAIVVQMDPFNHRIKCNSGTNGPI